MPKLSQRGVVHLIVLLILLAGIAGIVYLVTAGPLKIFPKAAPSLPQNPETSFELELEKNGETPFPDEATPTSLPPNSKFRVDVYTRADTDAANLFVAKIKYTSLNVELIEINRREGQSFVKNWVETSADHTNQNIGIVSMTGGIPNPGIQTNTQTGAMLMGSVVFRTKGAGTVKIELSDSSEIYSNITNTNILTARKGTIEVPIQAIQPSPTPIGGAFRFTASDNNTSLTCRKGDPNCYYSAAVIAVNNTNQTLYNTTLRLENQGLTATYVGFDGQTTSGQSKSDRPVPPGQEAISIYLRVIPPATVGRYTAQLYADGQTCNNNVTPPDCMFYGAGVFTVTINVVEQLPSPTPAPSATAVPTSSPTPAAPSCSYIDVSGAIRAKYGNETIYIVDSEGKVNLRAQVTPENSKVTWTGANSMNLPNGGKWDPPDSPATVWTAPKNSTNKLEGVGVRADIANTAPVVSCETVNMVVKPAPQQISTPTPSPAPFTCNACAADMNKDGAVTILDFSLLATCFNKSATETVRGVNCDKADVNKDGVVTILDFSCFASKFNLQCSAGQERGESAGMDQETRRSLQAQLEGVVTSGTGDGNRDGKINLVDLSILLSDFNKTTGFRQGIDLNGDRIVNTPDFILMRNLLIQRGVIRS